MTELADSSTPRNPLAKELLRPMAIGACGGARLGVKRKAVPPIHNSTSALATPTAVKAGVAAFAFAAS
jgi:hypothetical protein